MVPHISDKQYFKKAIGLLQNNPDSVACLAYARIAGWNYSFIEKPLTVVAIWNQYFPKKLHVGHDAFDDKGKTPEPLTRAEMEEIQKIEGQTNDPMKKGFDPFYFWKFPYPKQSRKFLEEQQEMRKALHEWNKVNNPEQPKMKPQRYWGD